MYCDKFTSWVLLYTLYTFLSTNLAATTATSQLPGTNLDDCMHQQHICNAVTNGQAAAHNGAALFHTGTINAR